jgi:two-component system CAI-1 autoinducer sensor kinase/phosphatase CqsS
VGGAMAGFCYSLTHAALTMESEAHLGEQFPILVFFVIVILVIKLDRRVLMEAKQRGMAAALASVAHELRTPLASIESTLVGFERHLPGLVESPETASIRAERLYAALRRMRVEVRNVHGSIDLLLANSRDQVSIPRVNFDLSDAVGKAIADYPFYYEEERRQIRLTLTPGVIVTGNEQLFRMVLNNLLKNALRAVARAGRGNITIAVEPGERGQPRLVFTDTAEGIDAEVLPRIFERFYTWPPGSGNGIGLSFCRSVLAQWGATIECQSELGEYTSFVINFPASRRFSAAVQRDQ